MEVEESILLDTEISMTIFNGEIVFQN